MSLAVVKISPRRLNLYGATSAQVDMRPVMSCFQVPTREPVIIDLDFSEADSISGSYLRATLLWCLTCGAEDVKGTHGPINRDDPWHIRGLPLFPVLRNCRSEVLEEAHDLLLHRNLPGIAVKEGEPPEIQSAYILGVLDPFLTGALHQLTKLGEASAQMLCEASPEQISANGWNNRLIDLLAFRLVTRSRSGKTWLYKPISKQYTLWA